MNAENNQEKSLKEKAAHEFKQFSAIFLYLAFFFCAVSTYGTILLNKFQVSYFTYGAALLNAFVIAKVILIGEYARLGRKHESKPLLLSAIHKAFLFSLLAFGFHIVEEIVRRLLRGDTVASASHELRIDDLLCRSLIIFCTFIPLFAFRELQRVLGEENFRDLFFRTGTAAKSDRS